MAKLPRRAPRVCGAFAIAALLLAALPALAQENSDCLDCHDNPDLVGTKNGEEVSVAVDPAVLAKSVHADNNCTDCHADLAGTDLPHEDELAPAVCDTCHPDVAEVQAKSLHGQAAARGDKLAPRCPDCHGSHGIVPRTDPESPVAKMRIPFLCGSCHHEGTKVSRERNIPENRILENYSESIHGEGLFKRGLIVSPVCINCHTAHNQLPHTDPESSIHPKNVARTCTQCHTLIEQVHRKVIEGRLWEEEPHKIPACTDCHSPHTIQRATSPTGLATADCLACHGKQDLKTVRNGQTISLFVDEAAMSASTHSKVACAQCHNEVTSSHQRPCEAIHSRVDCSICHAEVVKQYKGGIHGQLAAKGDKDAPGCLDCHEYHTTKNKKTPSSPTYPRNVPDLCARCHREGEKAAIRIPVSAPNVVKSYEESIHGTGLVQSGLVVTATCSDCHTPHAPLPPDDPKSSVNPRNVAATCGKCHHGIEERYTQSVHVFDATAEVKPGEHRKPTCESCHTSHTIGRTDQDNFRLSMMNQCGGCHEAEAETFFDTYHGKVSRLGSEGAAKCYDCHGTHDILPPDDPRSHLSRANVVETCGKCHEGSHRRFAGYLTHATHHDRAKYPWLFWSFWAMTGLLVGTLTFALVHTLAWLARLFLSRKDWRQHKHAPSGQLYRRFTTRQRGTHLTMMLSFFTLALTGMALKFSYMPWALGMARVLGGFHTMGVLHRIGALVLVGVFIAHFWSVYTYKREQNLSWWELITHPDSMMFNLNDLREIRQSFRWFLGRGERPRYGRYTYWEKFDYFAVVWGVAIIGSTGLVLWFPEVMTYILPGWSVNVATIIHSDEALLAVAFIFTVHFFNTHFRPDKFPMDPVIFTGRVPLEELKYDKPREYEEMLARGELEELLVKPYPEPLERGFRRFGFTALAVGLTLIGLIVYSMLFGYK